MLKFNLTSYYHHESHFCCQSCFCSFFCLNQGTLSEILRGELVCASLLWVESKNRWIQTRKTILVDILPNFLLVTKHPLLIKFNQWSWILLFRPLISSNSTLQHPVQPQTFRRALQESGFLSATKKKVPMLKKVYCQKRLEFAQWHGNWSVEDWKRVLWSDKTKINRIGSDCKDGILTTVYACLYLFPFWQYLSFFIYRSCFFLVFKKAVRLKAYLPFFLLTIFHTFLPLSTTLA